MESTVQPGTTRNSVVEIIANQDIEKAGIMISYCPERVSPGGRFGVEKVGESLSRLSRTDRILHLCIISLQSEVLHQSIQLKSPRHQNWSRTPRDIDIAFVNELSILCQLGLDVEKVLEAADTKWNFTGTLQVWVSFSIPIDPHYYIEIAERYGVNSALSPAG